MKNRKRRIHITDEDKDIVNYLKSVDPFINLSSNEIFALAMIFGKKKGYRTPLNGKISDFINQQNINSNLHYLIMAISVEKMDSLEILEDDDAYLTICEEYARTGFPLLESAYQENPKSFHEYLENELLSLL